MQDDSTQSGWKDKVLFTPGPVMTSRTVKQAMLRDLGSRGAELTEIVRDVRRRLLALGGASEKVYAAIPMQGSGTLGLEAVVSSTIPPDGKLLVCVNGADGRRIAQMARVLGMGARTLDYSESHYVPAQGVARLLARDHRVTHVAVVHCETSTGLLNPIRDIGAAVKEAGCTCIVDATRSFGGVPIDVPALGVDYLVSSASNCIEGVPGLSFVLANLDSLRQTEGRARSLSLNLLAQHRGLEDNGQFRFTPPTHAILAFHQALLELEAEGGVEARAGRYRENHQTLVAGTRAMGLREYLRPEDQSHIITAFYCPEDPKFRFDDFCERLSRDGNVICPGDITATDCFRIGTIGRVFPSDVRELLAAMERALAEMGVALDKRA